MLFKVWYSFNFTVFLCFQGGKGAPSLIGVHIVETNSEIISQSCTTAESCRYETTTTPGLS